MIRKEKGTNAKKVDTANAQNTIASNEGQSISVNGRNGQKENASDGGSWRQSNKEDRGNNWVGGIEVRLKASPKQTTGGMTMKECVPWRTPALSFRAEDDKLRRSRLAIFRFATSYVNSVLCSTPCTVTSRLALLYL